MTSKNVVFDVVGTLVGYDHLFIAIDTRLGSRLRNEGIKPSLLGYTWIEVAEREYTYLSMSGKYTVFADVFRALFYRMLYMAGIPEPRDFANDSDLEFIMAEYAKLKLRPGAKECIQKLRDAGFRVWCFTAGDIARVGGYFAGEGVEMPKEDLLSCDTAGIGKPDLKAYAPLLERLKSENNGLVPWFAAGHMWDVSAARRAGFKGAYSAVWEKEPLTELFGEMDKMSPLLPPNSITSFWRTEPHRLDAHRSTAELPPECDIAIIGSGYAGASVAHHLLNQTDASTRPRIVILEGRQACSGATGRNGGHLKPDPFNRIASLAAEYGIDAAKEVAEFEARHVDAVQKLVEMEKIDCDLTVTEAMDICRDDTHAAAFKKGYDALVEAGCEPTRQMGYIGADKAEEISGIKGAKACFTYKTGHLWPYKLIMHLLEKAVEKGVNLQTHTLVTSITELGLENYKIETSRGPINAKAVVVATNGYTSSILPQYRNQIIPVRGTCSRIIVPKSSTPKKLLKPATNSYMIRHNAWNYDYLVPRSDGSIIVGGARPAFINDPDNWYNVTDDSKVLDSAVRYFDGYMQRTFVGWEDIGAYTDRVWTGIMGYSADNLPHVGRVPGHETQFVLAGFTGHGMPQVYLAAEGIAKMVLQKCGYAESGLPKLFETSQTRLDSRVNRIHVPGREARL
ncbi:FAD dependent oxidoreductase-domain-containing protein [Aspergillus unguis]